MRAPLQVRFEKLQKLIERISDDAQRGRVVVVEGNKDRESLRSMGVMGKILCLKSSRRNTIGFVEELVGEVEVILLTDFDREGVFLAKQLARLLTSQNIHANLLFWRQLRGLTRSDIRSIEELPKLYDRLYSELNLRRPSRDLKHDS
jgi:5S rRNA maturation endonuclease (ribonuclease M5)